MVKKIISKICENTFKLKVNLFEYIRFNYKEKKLKQMLKKSRKTLNKDNQAKKCKNNTSQKETLHNSDTLNQFPLFTLFWKKLYTTVYPPTNRSPTFIFIYIYICTCNSTYDYEFYKHVGYLRLAMDINE